MNTTTLELQSNLRGRLGQVLYEIDAAARGAGRSPDSVRLVVVTKGRPLHVVEAAVQAGARILGENYAEEAAAKIDALGSAPGAAGRVEWHMIGHVQGRKAKLVAPRFDLIHSVDSLKLARQLDSLAAELGRQIPVLLECNVGGEAGKHGWDAADLSKWSGLLGEIEIVGTLSHLSIRGLMTMPPLATIPEDSRRFFRHLRELRDYLAGKVAGADWRELSMGTSADFSVAVEEGATLVRIGEAILGPRPSRETT